MQIFFQREYNGHMFVEKKSKKKRQEILWFFRIDLFKTRWDSAPDMNSRKPYTHQPNILNPLQLVSSSFPAARFVIYCKVTLGFAVDPTAS